MYNVFKLNSFLIRSCILSIILSVSYIAGYGQTHNQFNKNQAFWSELNISGRIKNKWSYQVDYQFRRQGRSDKVKQAYAAGGISDGNANSGIFTYPSQQVFRPWIAYQASEKLKLSLSPLGWWGTWTPNAAGGLNFQPEFRITTQAIYTHTLGRVTINQRMRYEFRFFGKNLPTDQVDSKDFYQNLTDATTRTGRFRYMIRSYIPLNRKKLEPGTVYLNLYDEALIGVGHNVKPERVFDQNRLFAGVGYKFSPQFRVEAGYLNQLIPRGQSGDKRNFDMNHVFQVFIVIDDFNSFFHKKEKSADPKLMADPD